MGFSRFALFSSLTLLACRSPTTRDENVARPSEVEGAGAVVPAAQPAVSGTSPRAVVLPAELEARLTTSCSNALHQKRPVLLDFGADWCQDCRALSVMKKSAPLAQELENWEVVDVDITDHDRYLALIDHFRVKAIARWVVLHPRDCAVPVFEWPPGPSRVVEPKTGSRASSEELVLWLSAARG